MTGTLPRNALRYPQGAVLIEHLIRRRMFDHALCEERPAECMSIFALSDLKAQLRETRRDLHFHKGGLAAARAALTMVEAAQQRAATAMVREVVYAAKHNIRRDRALIRAIRAAIFLKQLTDTAPSGPAAPGVSPPA